MRRAFGLALLFTCQLSAAVPALVQACGNATATGTSSPVSLGSNPTNGNNLIMVFTTPTAQSVSSLSGGGVTWLHAVVNTTNRGVDIWYGENVSSGGTTITVNFSGSLPGTSSDLNICEFSGLKTSGSLGKTNTANNAGSTVASVTLTPNPGRNSVLIMGESFIAGQTQTAGGFTPITVTNTRNAAAYLLPTPTTGSYTPQYTAASAGWGMAIASFEAAQPPGISIDNATTTTGNSSGCAAAGTSCTMTSYTVAAGATLMIVAVANPGITASVSTISWNGSTAGWVLGIAENNGAIAPRCELWYLKNPTAATSSIIVTYGAATSSSSGFAAYSFMGTDGVSPIYGATGQVATSVTSISDAVTVATAGDWLLDVVLVGSGGTATASGSPTAAQTFQGANGANAGGASYFTTVATGSQSLSWTMASANVAHAILAIKAASGAGFGVVM